MDPTVLAALIGVGGAIAGSAITGPAVAHLLSRRQRTVQAAQTTAQTEQLKAQTDSLRQDIYQQLTEDLRDELERVRASLRSTSQEAEQLRGRVVDLESRVAQLTLSEARASEALREVQTERDRLRADLAAREATITELRQQVADLRLQTALQPGHP